MHFLNRSLPRRTVLKGMGATLALPFLEAMLPPVLFSPQTSLSGGFRRSTRRMEWRWNTGRRNRGCKLRDDTHPGATRSVPRSDDRVLRAQGPAGTTSTPAPPGPSSPAPRAVEKRKSKSLPTFPSTS